MTKLEYLQNYLDSEARLRARHGETCYYSQPAIHEKEGEIIPVAPWANYVGDPLILPIIDFVDYMAVSEITDAGQIETKLYYLKHVVSLLDQLYGVKKELEPVAHYVVSIPYDAEETLRGIIGQLPPVGS